MRIVQMSDIHVGPTFVPDLLDAAIEEINAFGPHLVAIPGDLTTKGYREEFEEAKTYLDRLECENVVVVPGNHDGHNVGYYHFEDLFGKRESSLTLAVPEGEAKVVALDSSEPDLDEGQVGREHYAWIDSEFRGWDRGAPQGLEVEHHRDCHAAPLPGHRSAGGRGGGSSSGSGSKKPPLRCCASELKESRST